MSTNLVVWDHLPEEDSEDVVAGLLVLVDQRLWQTKAGGQTVVVVVDHTVVDSLEKDHRLEWRTVRPLSVNLSGEWKMMDSQRIASKGNQHKKAITNRKH